MGRVITSWCAGNYRLLNAGKVSATVQAAANGTAQTPASAFSNASGTMIVNEMAGSHMLARMAAADTVVIGRNASESSDYLAALRAGAPEDDKGCEPAINEPMLCQLPTCLRSSRCL